MANSLYDPARSCLGRTTPTTSGKYAGVTALEAVNCPYPKYLTEIDGVTVLGCDVPYEAIAAKELVRG